MSRTSRTQENEKASQRRSDALYGRLRKAREYQRRKRNWTPLKTSPNRALSDSLWLLGTEIVDFRRELTQDFH
jgi:hypothetical protein